MNILSPTCIQQCSAFECQAEHSQGIVQNLLVSVLLALTQYVDSHLWIRSLLPLQQNACLPRVNSTALLPFSSLMLFYLCACFDNTSVCELRHLTLVFYITLLNRRAHTNTHVCAQHLSLTAAVDVKRITV